MALAFGDRRTGGAAKVAIGLATLVLGIVTAGIASGGGPRWAMPLVAIVPIYLCFVGWVLLRRRVEFAPDRAEVVVTRTLLGIAWVRRIGFAAFDGVESRGMWMRPRGGNPAQGTPEGDALFIKYGLSLRRGRRGFHLDLMADVGRAEALAREAAAMLGVPAWRRGYVRRADGVPLWRRDAREPIG